MATLKPLLFDIDGTVVYAENRDSLNFAASYKAIFGKPFPSIDWERYPHVTDTTILKSVFEEQFEEMPSLELVEIFEQHYMAAIQAARDHAPHEYPEVPGARSLLYEALERGHPVAFATGGWKRPQSIKLAHVGIVPHHFKGGFADGQPTRKDIIDQALSELELTQVSYKDVVYVGDAAWDVRTTQALGMPMIGIRWRGDHDFMHARGVSRVLTNYENSSVFFDMVESM